VCYELTSSVERALVADKDKHSRSVSVLLTEEEFTRFEAFSKHRGHKKSTLIARLIREHLDGQQFQPQRCLPFPRRKEE